jgi:hypothetical protein
MDPGAFRFAAGASLPLSARFIGSVEDSIDESVRTANEAVEEGRALTEDEQRDLVSQALMVISFFPSPVFEFDMRYGVAENFDLGFRFGSGGARLDAKWRFFQNSTLDAAALVGYQRYSGFGYEFVKNLSSVFEVVAVAEHQRNDIDLGVLISGTEDDDSIFVPYGSLRYMASFNRIETEFGARFLGVGAVEQVDEYEETMQLLYGVIGARVGVRRFHLQLELGVGYVLFEPTIYGQPVDLSGLIFTPSIGLSFDTR